MIKKNASMLVFLLVAGLSVARFTVNLRQRAARAFPDKFSDNSFTEHLALIWEVLRWSGPHLAPEGTYHLTRYLSVPTPSGPVGLLPGQEVRVLREAGARVIVTAASVTGSRELDVPRSALTDDLDLARNLASRDRSSHEAFRDQVEAEEIMRERVRLGLYKEAAADLAAAERNRASDPSAGIGGRASVLQQGPAIRNGYAYPVVVPAYYPAGSGSNPATASSTTSGSTVNAGGSSSSGGGVTRFTTTESRPRTYTTYRPGSPPPEARAVPKSSPGQLPAKP